jgi:ABC-2 type transport system permease protein
MVYGGGDGSMRTFGKLLMTEAKIAVRGIDSIFFGILFPVGIAILIGLVTGNKPAFKGAEYTFVEQSFGALITVGVCATALMGIPLSISDYRDKKILKHYFVTPVSPGMLLIVQVCINLILAIISALSVFVAMKVFFHITLRGDIISLIGSFLLVTVSMYGIGMMIASISPNIKVANLLCTLIYFPMLFLSGATVPYEIMPGGVQKVMNVLPLTQGIKLLKGASLGITTENVLVPVLVMLGVGVVTILISVKTFRFE